MQVKITELIARHPEWKFKGDQLVGEWNVNSFGELKQIVAQLCELADELDHHPLVTYGYTSLRIETTTHDANNTVTDRDIEFAKRASKLL